MNKCTHAVSYFDRQGFLLFLHHQHQLRQRQLHLHLALADAMVGGVQGGASRRPSTNQRATSEVATAQPIRPRDGEKGGPRDVTTPLGQSTDLLLVLASDRATSDYACQNRPVRESGEGGGVPPPPWRQGG